jgi:hypothetical protein
MSFLGHIAQCGASHASPFLMPSASSAFVERVLDRGGLKSVDRGSAFLRRIEKVHSVALVEAGMARMDGAE